MRAEVAQQCRRDACSRTAADGALVERVESWVVVRLTTGGPFVPAAPLWMCARMAPVSPIRASASRTRASAPRSRARWPCRWRRRPAGTSFAPFSVAFRAFSPYARCALFDAVTQVLYAFASPRCCGAAGTARCTRASPACRFAVALVGLPASVASLVAAVAAVVHLVRKLRNAAVVFAARPGVRSTSRGTAPSSPPLPAPPPRRRSRPPRPRESTCPSCRHPPHLGLRHHRLILRPNRRRRVG